MPIHWSESFARQSRVGAAVNPVVDPVSGEPEFKHTPARIEPWRSDWTGFLLCRNPITSTDFGWWAKSKGLHSHRYELAGADSERPGAHWLRTQLGAACADANWIEYEDAATGSYRAAVMVGDKLLACLLIESTTDLPKREWLTSLFADDAVSADARRALLRGKPQGQRFDPGATICACHGVGANTIAEAIANGCHSVAAVGQRLRAGTNCGSCRPEIQRLIAGAGQKPVVATGLAING
jgi:assimilatory nitrate reductase catalytic subunit